MSLCDCSTPKKNFGRGNCTGILERPSKLCFVEEFDNDGVVNAILEVDVVDDTYVTGLINTGDKTNVATIRDNSKRWYPTGVINQVNDTRAEDNTFELDGFNITTSRGVRTMAFTVVEGANPDMAEAFNSLGCRKVGFYIWSIDGQIGGNDRIDGELRPFRIKQKTMSAIYQPPNKENETPAMVMVKFDLSELEKDKDIAYMDYGTTDNDVKVDILSYNGLQDITLGEATSITTTGFTTEIFFTNEGGVFDKDPVTGLVVADFTLYNETSMSAVTVLTAPESPDGTYALTYAAQTSADVLTLTQYSEGLEPTSTLTIVTP